MAIYQLQDIIKDTRIALDQNMTSEKLIEIDDIDTLSLNDIIKSKVVEAVTRVHSQAPIYLLDSGNNFGDAVYWKELNSGWVLLPDNFMRLIVFRMSDWERDVYHAIAEDDPEYEKQSRRFKGIRGTPQKPICAIVVRPEGRALEFYSCKNNDALVSKAVYLPYPYIDNHNGINICKKCYTSVIYTISSLVLSAYGDSQKSEAFAELSKTSLI